MSICVNIGICRENATVKGSSNAVQYSSQNCQLSFGYMCNEKVGGLSKFCGGRDPPPVVAPMFMRRNYFSLITTDDGLIFSRTTTEPVEFID